MKRRIHTYIHTYICLYGSDIRIARLVALLAVLVLFRYLVVHYSERASG